MFRSALQILLSIAVLALAASLGGCNGSSAGQSDLDEERRQTQTSTPLPGMTVCVGDLQKSPNVTCGFAAKVENAYYAKVGSGAGSVSSYSPDLNRSFTLRCSAGPLHFCSGEDGTAVFFH